MPITINTNISAMTAQRNLEVASNRSATSLSKLSSGSRVPNAKADAAALAIGTGLRADIAALRNAQSNAQQGVSVLQIADGSFGNITDILVRMKSISAQSQSDQVSNTERGFLQTEFGELVNEIDRIAASTEFNGTKLLGEEGTIILNAVGTNIEAADGFTGFVFDDGIVANADSFTVVYDDADDTITVNNTTQSTSQTLQLLDVDVPTDGGSLTLNFDAAGVELTLGDQFAVATDITSANVFTAQTGTAATASATLNFQVGIGTSATVDQIQVSINGGTANSLGVSGQNVSTSGAAGTASTAIDAALSSVNTARAELGAFSNRLEFAAANISVAIENVSAAKSSLLDVDVAQEITEFTSTQVLIQAGVSMLAQANQQPSLLLRLLQ